MKCLFSILTKGEFVTENSGHFLLRGGGVISYFLNGVKHTVEFVTEKTMLNIVEGEDPFAYASYKEKFIGIFECLAPFSINILPKNQEWFLTEIGVCLPLMDEVLAFQMGGWKTLKLLRKEGQLGNAEGEDVEIVKSLKLLNDGIKGKSPFFNDILIGAVVNSERPVSAGFHKKIMEERGVLYFE